MATLIDGCLPSSDYATVQSTAVATSLQKTFRVVGEVTPADVPELGGIGRRLKLDPDQPLYAQLFGSGFVILTSDPLREVVVGHVVRPWRPLDGTPQVMGRRDFVRFRKPAHVKAAVGLRMATVQERTELTIEVRLQATDPASRGAASLLGRRAGPTIERVARGWLDAVTRLAEAQYGGRR